MTLRTYVTQDRHVIDLTTLTDPEMRFYEECLAAYRGSEDFTQLMNRVQSAGNPALAPTQGWITEAAWTHPLFQACRDLADRVGLREGWVATGPGNDPACDPADDAWLTMGEALARKAVTASGLHRAIVRGAVVAHPARPGGTRRVISRASLDAWTPNPVRQAARQGRASTTPS